MKFLVITVIIIVIIVIFIYKKEKEYIYSPKNYNLIEKELSELDKDYSFIPAIKGCDFVAGKNYLWDAALKFYGREKACHFLPNTWSLKPGLVFEKGMYIAKKNIQQQKGLLLLDSKDICVEDLISEDYVVIQEYLKNPFIINTFKINLRVYILIVVFPDNVKKLFIYNDGFIYYSKKAYTGLLDPDSAITTGYIDRKVYETCPLTHGDLKTFLKKENKDYNKLFQNTTDCIKAVVKSLSNSLSGPKGSTSYQIFGADIQPDINLNVKLIEINKNPDLSSKDFRDNELKTLLKKDIKETVFSGSCSTRFQQFCL